MNNHELWNEIGNLYFLSGAYNQAVFAYNKAINSESDYGKPYGNLALIYAKQANYDKAINFYKKSLVLLNNEVEKATAWNRLGNVYWHLKKYQEAAMAYERADALRAGLNGSQEQGYPMLNVFSESQSYDLVEQQDCQNPFVDYLGAVDTEINEAIPVLVPLEDEMLAEEVKEFENIIKESVAEKSVESVLSIPATEVETTLSSELENKVSMPPESIEDENIYPESEESIGDEPDKQIIFDEPLIEPEIQMSVDSVTPGESYTEEVEITSEWVEPATLSADATPESTPTEEETSIEVYTDQSEMLIEAQPDNLMPVFPETNIRTDGAVLEADSGFSEPIDSSEEVVELQPDMTELAPIDEIPFDEIPSIEEIQDIDFSSAEPVTQDLENVGISGQELTGPVDHSFPVDPIKQTIAESSQEIEKEIAEEEKKLERQIEINPRSATTWEALGTLYKTAGRYEEAIQAFKHAISIAPGKVTYYHNLGLVYSAQGNNTEAFNTFQKVLELDPNHSLTHASLGGYYKKIGLDELAQKHIGKAMKSIYESENEYNRACLDAICGNVDQAIDLLRTALENKQTYVDWVIHDPDLDSLREDDRFKQLISEFTSY